MNSSQSFKLVQDVYNSRKHLLEMLEDRGYNVEHLKNYNLEEMSTMLTEHIAGKFTTLSDIGPLDIFLEKKVTIKNAPVVEKIYVKYNLENKFKGTANTKKQIAEIYENHLTTKDTLIFININRLLMKVAAKEKTDEDFVNDLYTTKNYFIQLFGLENFLFNISHHQFVPKHRILSHQETKELLEKYSCNIKNLPTIKRDDPMAKYIGLRIKQICEIKRENITSGVTTHYRLCVS